MKYSSAALLAALLTTTPALGAEDVVGAVIEEHILPGYETLERETAELEEVAGSHCKPGDTALQNAFHDAFDAWIAVSHLNFGPAEEGDRYFSLMFWPDARGITPRALSNLLKDEDPAVLDPQEFSTVSVAARGFFGMEYLLYDEQIRQSASDDYVCKLVQALAADIYATSATLEQAWREDFADLMRNAGQNDRFQNEQEVLRTLFSALDHGLEFSSELRLGRPLGEFGNPRPRLAEAWRSARSLRNIEISTASLQELALILAQDHPEVSQTLRDSFEGIAGQAAKLEPPLFADIDDPQRRFPVEVLQQRVATTRDLVRADLGPALGVSAGFNALDGD